MYEKCLYSSSQVNDSKIPKTRQRNKQSSRSLPQKSIDIMTNWYDKHYTNPYPTFRDCEIMAGAGNITVNQVKQWFVNIRRRTGNQFRRKRNPYDIKQKNKECDSNDLIKDLENVIPFNSYLSTPNYYPTQYNNISFDETKAKQVQYPIERNNQCLSTPIRPIENKQMFTAKGYNYDHSPYFFNSSYQNVSYSPRYSNESYQMSSYVGESSLNNTQNSSASSQYSNESYQMSSYVGESSPNNTQNSTATSQYSPYNSYSQYYNQFATLPATQTYDNNFNNSYRFLDTSLYY